MKSQNERVEKRLRQFGQISRNDCLRLARPPITRLSARIQELEKKGWEFQPEDTGKDYVYKVIRAPMTVDEMVAHSRDLVKLYFGE